MRPQCMKLGYDDSTKLVYEGEFVSGLRHGVGKEYHKLYDLVKSAEKNFI